MMDAVEMQGADPKYEPVYFWDPEGNQLAGWQVSLDAYVEGHRTIPGDWELAHRLAVARSIAEGNAVPDYALNGHSQELLGRIILRERCLHGDKEACNEYRAAAVQTISTPVGTSPGHLEGANHAG